MNQSKTDNRLRITLAQINTTVGDVTYNTQKIISLARQLIDEKKPDLIVFPELAITGYPPEDLLLRPELYERVDKALQSLCQQVPDGNLIIGYPCLQNGKRYNTASLMTMGKISATYFKHCLPNYNVFDEIRYFTSGYQDCVFDLKGIKIGLTICEDIWQSAPIEKAVAAGAQIIININASPYHSNKHNERESIIRKRTTENNVPILYTNLVGGQDELVFEGASFVMDSEGNKTHQLKSFAEDNADIEFNLNNNQAIIKNTLTAESFSMEASLYNTIKLGIQDYIKKNGFNGAILGLSGGIDSSLTLALAVDAIGKENVDAMMMPSQYTSQLSLDEAAAQAALLGVNYSNISIEPAFQSFLQMLENEFSGFKKDVTEENIQARCRGVLLMAISNKKRKILLTTGNKSEMAVGYATLYGDMAGGFAPIKDLSKTWVYKLSRYRNTLSPAIPENVITRPPSAELAPNQKDEDSLPPYSILDNILENYIEKDQSIEEIVNQGYDSATVRRVTRMVDLNEYKRRQAPPGVRLTKRAFGRDRRYPITSGFRNQ